jgi:hypothetical protein
VGQKGVGIDFFARKTVVAPVIVVKTSKFYGRALEK